MVFKCFKMVSDNFLMVEYFKKMYNHYKSGKIYKQLTWGKRNLPNGLSTESGPRFCRVRKHFLSNLHSPILRNQAPQENAALQFWPLAVSIRLKNREVRESENVNANRVEFSKKSVKLPARKRSQRHWSKIVSRTSLCTRNPTPLCASWLRRSRLTTLLAQARAQIAS